MSFLETPRFPEDISWGSHAAPRLKKTRTETHSGRRYLNEDWQYPLHEYDVSFGVRNITEMYTLTNFFMAVGGNKFRYKDWNDYKSCAPDGTPVRTDQVLGTGDGATKDFPIYKTYTSGALTRTRPIIAPVASGFLVGDNGSPAGTWALTFVNNTWIVRFNAAPVAGHALTWGGEFDVPCEFAGDDMPATLEDLTVRQVSIPVAETRQLV